MPGDFDWLDFHQAPGVSVLFEIVGVRKLNS